MFTNPEDKLGTPEHTWQGAAIGWHIRLQSNISQVETVCDRFTGVKEEIEGSKFFLKSVYFPTFHHNNSLSESNVDYFLVSKQYSSLASNITKICTLNQPMNLSSHDGVECFMKVAYKQFNEDTNQFCNTYSDCQPKYVIWDLENVAAYEAASDEPLTEMESIFDTPEWIPLECELYSRLIVRCAEQTLKLKTKLNSAKKYRIFSQKQNQAWEHLNKCYKLWFNAGKPRDKTNQCCLSYRKTRSNF